MTLGQTKIFMQKHFFLHKLVGETDCNRYFCKHKKLIHYFLPELLFMEEIFDFIDDPIDKSAFTAKFTPQMCEFEEGCVDTLRYFPNVVHLFQWFGLNTLAERSSALEHMGYMLLHELNKMRTVYNLRKLQLCDEHCDKYEGWLRLIDKRIKKYCQFADEAQDVLNHLCWNISRLRLLIKLDRSRKWMEEIVTMDNPIARSSDKCNELNLHYEPQDLLTEPESVRNFFYLMLHFMALLAIPSHKEATDKELTVLFRESLAIFMNSKQGKNVLEGYADKIEDELSGQNDEQQLESVRNYKKTLAAEIRKYLEKFGVDYCGIDKDKNAGSLCRQLYERLNGICTDEEKEQETDSESKPKKMTNKVLCSYFAREIKMQYLKGKIKELNETVEVPKKSKESRKSEPGRRNAVSGEEKKTSWSGIFIVDENKLASSFRKLYNNYFGEKPKYRLEGKCDQSLFIAYLYLLVEKEQLGKENFAENTRRPFFEFIAEKVVNEMEKTVRTFHNRVDELQSFRKILLSKDDNSRENPVWTSSIHYKNFHGICGNFHKTSYSIELGRLKK